MARYIDADALLLEDFTDAFVDIYDVRIFEHIIENAPTADVVEVKHGEWIGGEFNNYSGEYEEQCSNCKKFSREYTRPYCPNCGAKMDLSEKPTGCERRDT